MNEVKQNRSQLEDKKLAQQKELHCMEREYFMSMSELVLNIEELEELSEEMVDPAILNELL